MNTKYILILKNDEIVVFKDKNLGQAVRKQINKLIVLFIGRIIIEIFNKC